MKSIKFILSVFMVSAIALWFGACGGNTHDHEHHSDGDHTESHMHGEGEAYTSAYVCPMHCEGSGSDEPGTCPVCGMDYVELEKHREDGHSHQ